MPQALPQIAASLGEDIDRWTDELSHPLALVSRLARDDVLDVAEGSRDIEGIEEERMPERCVPGLTQFRCEARLSAGPRRAAHLDDGHSLPTEVPLRQPRRRCA